ncbi:hypothetical protein CDAR_531141 [Caerostris darwini]|uniref:Uncharacterized protein n=1 Tax=Caerostris darwini TaxID=1538125 RepID=A0AAV4Q5H8_9ARAC|nr:hypothetical protein CDAR_531141 [Caerostris darwini]
MQSIIQWLYNRAIRRPLKEDKKQVEKKKTPFTYFRAIYPKYPQQERIVCVFPKTLSHPNKGNCMRQLFQNNYMGRNMRYVGPGRLRCDSLFIDSHDQSNDRKQQKLVWAACEFSPRDYRRSWPFFTALYLPLKALKVRHRGAHKCGFITNSEKEGDLSLSLPPD